MTSNLKFHALNGLQLEAHDDGMSVGGMHIDQADRSNRTGSGVHELAGAVPRTAATMPATGQPTGAEADAATAEAGDTITAWTVEIVLAYLSNNGIDAAKLPRLIADLNGVLWEIAEKESAEKEVPPRTGLRPAVAVERSVTPDYIVCLEDGRRFKSMKRHLKAAHNLTPTEYRAKWGLPESYPMIAPRYAETCSDHAKARRLWERPSDD